MNISHFFRRATLAAICFLLAVANLTLQAWVDPSITTLQPTAITTNSAVPHGTFQVNGSATWTIFRFEYGTTTSYGGSTAWRSYPNSDDNPIVITGLQPYTYYFYRIVMQNSLESKYGNAIEFYTSPGPLVKTYGANWVASTSAELQGRVNSYGKSVDFYFQYGLTANYGSNTGTNYYWKGIDTSVGVTTSNLAPNTIYHYRIAAGNSDGWNYGSDMAFTTAPAPAPELSATITGNELILSWPQSASDYVLVTSTDLNDTNSWTMVADVPTLNGDVYQVTNLPAASMMFYRLKK